MVGQLRLTKTYLGLAWLDRQCVMYCNHLLRCSILMASQGCLEISSSMFQNKELQVYSAKTIIELCEFHGFVHINS